MKGEGVIWWVDFFFGGEGKGRGKMGKGKGKKEKGLYHTSFSSYSGLIGGSLLNPEGGSFLTVLLFCLDCDMVSVR